MHLDVFLELGANITRCLAAECSVPAVESTAPLLPSSLVGRGEFVLIKADVSFIAVLITVNDTCKNSIIHVHYK